METFNQFINERNLGSIRDNIQINVSIESTKHSDDRKYRHGNNVITDQDIIEVAELAIPKIVELMIIDKIDIGDYLHIKDTQTDLNLIGVLKGNKMPLTLKVITLMIKRNFKSKSGTTTIKI